MNKKTYLISIVIVLLISLVLAGCGSEEPAPTKVEEPVATAQTVVEGATASSSGQPATEHVQVTSIDQIVGTWIAPAYPGNFVLTIFPDGILKVATSLEDLERGSTDTWNLNIEDGQITATGFALCLGDTGSYIAEIDEEGNLRFISIIDACDSRLRKMHRSLPDRLHEYILIYRPVE